MDVPPMQPILDLLWRDGDPEKVPQNKSVNYINHLKTIQLA